MNFPNGALHQHQIGTLSFGFSSGELTKKSLRYHLNAKEIRELNQVHSNQIYYSSSLSSGESGDGLILDEQGILAIIKTADCIPLFFFSSDHSFCGILHIGWRGAALDIEEKLFLLLKTRTSLTAADISFYFGPSICRDCYEVDEELKDKFQNQRIINQIFRKKDESDKYLLDLKKKVTLGLIAQGVPIDHITDSGICTRTNFHFFSYRRDFGIKGRILNYMIRF